MLAMTSLALVLVDVPEPVWKTSMGKCSSNSPAATRLAAAAMSLEIFFGRWPHLGDVVYAFGVATAALVLAAIVFRRVDDQLAAQL